jgi:hypothetical protein
MCKLCKLCNLSASATAVKGRFVETLMTWKNLGTQRVATAERLHSLHRLHMRVEA